MVFAIKKSQNIDVLSIKGLKGKLQAQEERVNMIQEDVGCTSTFLKQDGYAYFKGG
jgi:hypothetical protein